MALRDGAWCQDRRYETKDQALPCVGVPRQQGFYAAEFGRTVRPVWCGSIGAKHAAWRRNRLRDRKPRQPGMGAQWLTDQIGAAGVQLFLEQAVGQQIGGDHDTRAVAACWALPCPRPHAIEDLR